MEINYTPTTTQKNFEETLNDCCLTLKIPSSVPNLTVLDQIFAGLMDVTQESEEKLQLMVETILSHNPGSLLEAQMIAQLLMCHRLCTKMLKKTAKESYPEITKKYLNMAMKLSRNFNKGLETLNKIQRGGMQHIVVENVYVEKDAQAIIGNVSKGG